jgi:hypothetical protein
MSACCCVPLISPLSCRAVKPSIAFTDQIHLVVVSHVSHWWLILHFSSFFPPAPRLQAGAHLDRRGSILDTPITSTAQRSIICLGSHDLVAASEPATRASLQTQANS